MHFNKYTSCNGKNTYNINITAKIEFYHGDMIFKK